MKRFRLKKTMAVVGTLMLVLIASLSYAEQYEAISTDSRSLRYTNTFGLFSNDYDGLVNPRLLGRLQGQRVITNLTNLDDQNEFQLGYGGPLGPGNVAGIISVGAWGEDASEAYTTVSYEDTLTPDGVDDTKIEYSSIDRTEFWNASNLDGYLGYGYPLDPDTGLGIGMGYNRSSYEDYYWDPYADDGGAPFALFNFTPIYDNRRAPMYIRDYVDTPGSYNFYQGRIVRTDLSTGDIIRTETWNEDGSMKSSNNEIDILLGADRKLGPKLTASLDVIIGFGSQKNEGSGIYTYRSEMEGSNYTEEETSSLNETFNSMRRYGVAVEGQYAAHTKHLLHLDLGYEAAPGKIKESEYTAVYNFSSNNLITGETSRETLTYRSERSGNTNKMTGLAVGVRDEYTVSDIISMGFGGQFVWYKSSCDYTDTATHDAIETHDDNGIWGDNPGDDLTYTENANMSRDISAESTGMIFAFPVTALIKVTEKLELRLGGRYSHYIQNSEFTDNLASHEGLSSRTVYADGRIEEDPPPAYQSYDDTSVKMKSMYVESQGDIRVGLGYKPSDNFELELLMASEGLSPSYEFDPFSFDAGNYEGSRIDRAYLSGTLKLK